MEPLDYAGVVDLAGAKEEPGYSRQHVAEQEAGIHAEAIGEQQQDSAVGDDHAQQPFRREPVARHEEVSEYRDPDRERDREDGAVARGRVVKADVHEPQLHRKQDAKDQKRHPLPASDAQIGAGRDGPDENHDGTGDESQISEAEGWRVIQARLDRY